jgi:hypothetical protein
MRPKCPNLVATFSEPVAAGTGNIELWQAGGGSPLESFEVATPSPRLTFSDATLTIDPTSNLTNRRRISCPDRFDRSRGHRRRCLCRNFGFRRVDFTADGILLALFPSIPPTMPPAVPVTSNLVATFSEPVVAGTGNIELWQVGGRCRPRILSM